MFFTFRWTVTCVPLVLTHTACCSHAACPQYERRITKTTKRETVKYVRVNTSKGSVSADFISSEESPIFVPNMRRRNLALGCKLQPLFTADFEQTYRRQRDLYFSMNKTDERQETDELFTLQPMMDAVRCEWADDATAEDPWYANCGCMCLSTITCTAACWFVQMRQWMCSDSYTFTKRVSGFSSGGVYGGSWVNDYGGSCSAVSGCGTTWYVGGGSTTGYAPRNVSTSAQPKTRWVKNANGSWVEAG